MHELEQKTREKKMNNWNQDEWVERDAKHEYS